MGFQLAREVDLISSLVFVFDFAIDLIVIVGVGAATGIGEAGTAGTAVRRLGSIVARGAATELEAKDGTTRAPEVAEEELTLIFCVSWRDSALPLKQNGLCYHMIRTIWAGNPHHQIDHRLGLNPRVLCSATQKLGESGLKIMDPCVQSIGHFFSL